METLTLTFAFGAIIGTATGATLMPIGLRLALEQVIRLAAHRLAALNTEHDRQALILTRRLQTERDIKAAIAQSAADRKAETMRIIRQCAEVKMESLQWQAVARNIATSHPEGAIIFQRVVAAHGLDRPAVELVPLPEATAHHA